MSGADRRAATGEAIFRDVNERVVEIDRAHGVPEDEVATFLCECSDTACVARIALSVAEYEHIRREATRFVVVPGHENGGIERVVERRANYNVVEKTGEAAEVAREHDPRDDG